MRIKHFGHGRGFVVHKYSVAGSECKFSVWFNRDGFAIDAERIDSMCRAYPVTPKQWGYIQRLRLTTTETKESNNDQN